MNFYMKEAILQAKKAYKKNDIPVGAVIVENNKIISKAYNQKNKKNNAILHAEIIAINKACKKKHTWHLDNCILYTTMEPCMMCCGALIQSRIKKIIYLVNNDNYGCTYLLINSKIKVEKCNYDNEMVDLLKKFFKVKRKKSNVSRETS